MCMGVQYLLVLIFSLFYQANVVPEKIMLKHKNILSELKTEKMNF